MASEYNTLQFARFDAAKSFVEIVEAFGIDKIRVGFRAYDKTQESGSRVTQQIDFYLSPIAALEMAENILSGVVKGRRVKWEADPNRNDNAEFYATAPGGAEVNGKTIYRIVKIQPGKNGYRLCAYTADGTRDAKGLIQPLKGAKFSYVMVPMTGMQLAMFARTLVRAVNSYDTYRTLNWMRKAREGNR